MDEGSGDNASHGMLNDKHHDGDDRDDGDADSADEALWEMLGLSSLTDVVDEKTANDSSVSCLSHFNDRLSKSTLSEIVEKHKSRELYSSTQLCILPVELSIPASFLRLMTEQVVWGARDKSNKGEVEPPNSTMERVNETIQVQTREGTVESRRVLTRLENLNEHAEWNLLCNDYIRRIVSAVVPLEDGDWTLLKTKLNLKPCGSAGFAPHVDAPSLQIPFLEHHTKDNTMHELPQSFVTVMIAIDDMTVANGCLRVASNLASYAVKPPTGTNPDADGRAGALCLEHNGELQYTDIECKGGTCVMFGGWVPHRSSANNSSFSRRAVFLTYAPTSAADAVAENDTLKNDNDKFSLHDWYYTRMRDLRRSHQQQHQEPTEIAALASIPRI